MMKESLNLDVKTLVMIITFAATAGGFYYATQDRLDHLEEAMTSFSSDITSLEKKIQRLSRQIKVNKK